MEPWMVLVLVAVIAVVLIVGSRLVGDPSRPLSGMWRYSGPAWPSGVQEDDDAHWSWAQAGVPRPEPDEVIEGIDIDGEVAEAPEVGAVRYEVRSARDRS